MSDMAVGFLKVKVNAKSLPMTLVQLLGKSKVFRMLKAFKKDCPYGTFLKKKRKEKKKENLKKKISNVSEQAIHRKRNLNGQ